jgi:FSR family fosmidomycin resistance protein-like MFS transporter
MYMGFPPALLPLIVPRFGLDYTGAGLLVAIMTITAQFSQPLFGFVGDRVGRRPLAIAAPAVTALSLSMLGLANTYGLLVALLVVGSVSTAAFHPQGAALVAAVARRRTGLAMAAFTAGGNVGFGFGSVLVALVVDRLGYAQTWLTVPVGLLAAGFLLSAIPRTVESPETRAAERSSAAPGRWLVPLVVLYFVVMLRAAIATMVTTFVPLLMRLRGETLVRGGAALFVFAAAGALGGFVGGRLAESWGGRKVTVVGLALTAPALYLFLHTDDLAAAAFLFLAGGCLFSALPINIVMGQQLLPRHASTVSGIIMGFAWGVGGLSATALGALADHWKTSLGELAGLAHAMDLVPLFCLLAALLAAALPRAHPTPQPVDTA